MENFQKKSGVCMILIAIFSASLGQTPSCDLQKVQACFRESVTAIGIIFVEPLKVETVLHIAHTYCEGYYKNRYQECLDEVKGSCTDIALARYKMLSLTLNVVCLKDIDIHQTCLTSPRPQDLIDGFVFEQCYGLECSAYENLEHEFWTWTEDYCTIAADFRYVNDLFHARMIPYKLATCHHTEMMRHFVQHTELID